ncbi:MAG: hydroxyacid dehydrogenase [Atopobiaceae bacterium]|nr:hydroxyacid dehydrogenase [Atopobiaceae bacterium]
MSVYLSEYIDPSCRAKLEEKFEVVDNFDKPEEVEAIILRIFPVDAALMDKLPNLKIISKHGVGCNTIDIDAAKERGIIVTNTPGANANSVAELIVGLMLDICRNITVADRKSQAGEFSSIAPKEMTGIELTGKTLGLIGAGNIARIVGKILVGGFDAKVIAYDPYMPAEAMASFGYEKVETVAEVIERSDIVNVSVPLTPETENLIAGDMFDKFKPNAILVNAARGGIVNEDDLYDALKAGKLRAAACDAFVTEPPTAANTKLYELDNFIGTPHIGAGTEEALIRMGDESVANVITVLEGGEPPRRVA